MSPLTLAYGTILIPFFLLFYIPILDINLYPLNFNYCCVLHNYLVYYVLDCTYLSNKSPETPKPEGKGFLCTKELYIYLERIYT